ncbi:MAG: GEVED domain-containing protein [Flavobacteriales bacterium]
MNTTNKTFCKGNITNVFLSSLLMMKKHHSLAVFFALTIVMLNGVGNNLVAQTYCTPTYSSGTGSGDYISLVQIPTTTLNKPSGASAAPYWTVYPTAGSTTATLTQGATYTLKVAGGTYTNAYVSAWIDYNQDGDFADAGEFIGSSPNCGNSTTVNLTTSWIISCTSTAGVTRLRLRSTDVSPGPSSAQSCGAANSGFGETEDYNVTIVAVNPISNAGSDQPSLGCANSTTLAGNNPSPYTGLWTFVSGSGTITSPGQYNTTVTGLGGGANTLRWTVSSGACAVSDDVVLTRSVTYANAGQDQGICTNSATLAGNNPTTTVNAAATGVWTLVSGSGTITTPTLYNTTVTNLGAGNNVFRWTVTYGGCSPSDDVTISSIVTDTWVGLGAVGDWNDGANWDMGVPPTCANVVIGASANQPVLTTNKSIASLTVDATATLTIASTATLTLSGNLTVNGTLDNVGKLTMSAGSPTFTMGATGTYIHQPNITPTNVNSADMFVKATESFHPTSTLVIKSWYAVNTPLAANMTGNYGNLTIEPNVGTVIYSTTSTIVRWFQNNLLLSKIKGDLTVGSATIIVAPTPPTGLTGVTGAISLVVSGDIILNNTNTNLVGIFHFNNTPIVASDATVYFSANKIIQSNGLFKGIENLNPAVAATGALTIETVQGIEVSGGTFYGGLSGNGSTAGGSVDINSSITLTNTGKLYGVQNCTAPLTISATNINLSNTAVLVGQNYTLFPTNGNFTLNAGSINLLGSSTFTGVELGTGSVTIGDTIAPNISVAGTAVFKGINAAPSSPNSTSLNITASNVVMTGGNFTGNYNGSGDVTITTDSITLSGTSLFNNLEGTVSTSPASGALTFSASNIRLTSGTPTFNMGSVATTGTFTASITNNLTVNAGFFNIKRETGIATLTVGGDCNISGGELNLFNPISGSTNTSAIGLTVNGNFIQSSGTFEFDKTTTNTTGSRTLTLKGNFIHSGGTFRGIQETISTAIVKGTIAQNMTGASPTTFYNLTIDNLAGVNMSGGSSTTVNNTLALTNGLLMVDNSELTLANTATITGGTFGVTKMIVTNGTGMVNRKFIANGSFLFPLGDNTGTTEYSPITINFTAGTYAVGAYASAAVTNVKHPNNGSNTNYLTRYWSTSVSGITAYTANVTGIYNNADITGTETSIANGKYMSSLPWVKSNVLDTANNAVIFTSTSTLGDFSGISLDNPTVTITGDTTRCLADAPTQLLANALGDTTFTYSWSPTTGLSNSTINNPTANPSTTTTYVVTVTDANGFVAVSPDFTLTVNSAPATPSPSNNGALCEGTTLNLMANVSGSTAYLWNGPGGFTSTLENPSVVGVTTSNTGTYSLVITENGCSSAAGTTTVVVNQSTSFTQTFNECQGFSITVGTNTYTTTGIFTDVLTGSNGCDSTVTTDLTINTFASGTDVQTACNSYTWIDGNNYTASTNTPTYTIAGGSSEGCDSIVTLNLTINTFASGTDVQTACNSYTWIDGNNYTASTNTPTYTVVGGSYQGCDSVVTLNLTINNSTTGTDVQTACNSYTWIDGNNYTTSTNTPTYTIVGGSYQGCDSIVTLNLTINTFASGTDVQTACNSYTWIDGNNYTASTNTPTYTIVGGSSEGCDSVVTLNLTINTVDNSTSTNANTITANVMGATYQWLDCDNNNAIIAGETNQNYIATANGNYAVEVTQNGCTDTSSCVNITGVGLEEYNKTIAAIYPNPTLGEFTINLKNAPTSSVGFTLTTLEGKVIQQEQKVSSTTIVMGLSEQPKGIYLLKIEDAQSVNVYKIIRQ